MISKQYLVFLLFLSGIAGLQAQKLPWEIEMPLKEYAKEVSIIKKLNRESPQPDVAVWPYGSSLQLLNPAIRSTIWGPADQITVSLIKNDVWDRRISPKKFTSPTLEEIKEGAYAEINKDFSDLSKNSTRPQWGYLRKEGGKFNPYLDVTRYPFPTLKKVGQFIWLSEDFLNVSQPDVCQSMADAKTTVLLEKNGKKADLEFILGMKRNTYGLRSTWNNLEKAVTFRLYRNKDTGYLSYMTPDGSQYKSANDRLKEQRLKEYESERSWNGPLDAPEAGKNGNFCWIYQKLPPEKTFPQGFEYVMMAYIPDLVNGNIVVSNDVYGMGTKTPYREINEASGAAVSWTFCPENGKPVEVYITVITTLDAGGKDIFKAARQELIDISGIGFAGMAEENTKWYADFYDKRENGRIFYGKSAPETATEDMKDLYYSWFCMHDGGTNTDMTKYQASAHYVVPELDVQPYGSLPCYNEVFYTPYAVRNRAEQAGMWKKLVMHWAEAGKKNARETYGKPGMYITHGFLPPIKPDRYVHTNVALELSVETMAQIIKPWWDEWDYTGDIKVLKELYPYLKDVVSFYATYVEKGEDGICHIIPSMQEESFGIQPEFSHSKDCIAAICMFKWAFRCAANAAGVLNRDKKSAERWLQIADNLPSYPLWKKKTGQVFATIPGIEPWRGAGEHGWYVGDYPVTLGDDINLDSDSETKATMIRTTEVFPASLSHRARILLGIDSDLERGDQYQNNSANKVDEPERLLNSRSGKIHLFPCLRKGEKEIAFRDFQARGGFLVSACYDGKAVTFVEIESRRSLPCRVMNPWLDCTVEVIELPSGKIVSSSIDKSKGECIMFDAKKGKTYQLRTVR